LSERIYRLVFWLYAVYTIGPCTGILILQKHDKSTGGSKTVGASLLANASVGSASMLSDTTLSRAGSLPQGIVSSQMFFLY